MAFCEIRYLLKVWMLALSLYLHPYFVHLCKCVAVSCFKHIFLQIISHRDTTELVSGPSCRLHDIIMSRDM